HGNAESRGDGAQQAVGVELRRHELRGDDLAAVQLAQQAANERGLPRADFAGEHDEALALVEPVLEVGVRALVPAAPVEEARIRAELEGRGRKSEVRFEHASQSKRWFRPTNTEFESQFGLKSGLSVSNLLAETPAKSVVFGDAR